MATQVVVSSSPFTAEHVAKWASFGSKQRGKTPEEMLALKQRRLEVNAMKKQLAKELGQQWSEKKIARELDRLVLLEQENNGDKSLQETLPEYMTNPDHRDNIIDHRSQGGPLMQCLWSEPAGGLQGQTLYLGGEIGSDGNIYCIPGHASHVLKIDTKTNKVSMIGPHLRSNGRLYKWLRGIVVGDVIYGIPCHASEILKIHVPTQTVTTLPLPYQQYYDAHEAQEEESCIWKYHGGAICPIDNCIYAIPQRALQVLKFDFTTETASFVGPKFPGRCKWYGGIVGKSDGAIYAIPQNAKGVLRITPTSITIHGDYGIGNHKWHGGAAAENGTIVSVPANANSVLCVVPGDPEPTLYEIPGDDTVVPACGRHRDDGKYKYLGAMACGNKVYVFPCASEYVLEVNAATGKCRNVGPNLRDSQMENVWQNKWQNGLTCDTTKCVYGMPLSSHTLLRIDCSHDKDDTDDNNPIVTTWTLPLAKRECRDKFEGGVILPSTGVMYTVPNNHKCVLRIEPANFIPASSKG